MKGVILRILALCVLAVLIGGGCNRGDQTQAIKQPVKVGQSILILLDELARFGVVQPGATPEQQSARAEAVRKAKDALLDAKTPFNDKTTLACWLQGMGEPLSDKTITDLAASSYGETAPDPRMLFALGMMVWNHALQAGNDPFRWKEDSSAASFGRQAIDIFKRASDLAPENGLLALTLMYADYSLVGKLQATLMSYSWPEEVQGKTAGRIESLLKRFAEAKTDYGMTGPPYFAPLESWKAQSAQETVGGYYDGAAASAIFPACAVLIIRDLSKQKKPEEMPIALTAVEKLLAFKPESYDRLSSSAVSLREISQTIELAMMDPAKRGEAAACSQKARDLFDSIKKQWVDKDAAKYAKLMTTNKPAAMRLERAFTGRYNASVLRQLAALKTFIQSLKPEDLNAKPPQAPFSG
jgi:hypothetical protein